VFTALREVAAMPDASARKAALLDRLDHIWELALSRTYLNKHGDEIATPDLGAAEKVVVTAAELVGATEGQPAARRPIDLSVFNGGAGAPRKVAG
jgi:hypothetical protein